MVNQPPVEYLISESDAQPLLAPFHQAIGAAITKAFEEWKTVVLPLLPQFTEAAQSSFILCALERELRTQLGAHPDLKFSPVGADRFGIRIKETVLIRFKKINDALTTSNVRTSRSEKFDRQLDLPGLPQMPRITIGYRLTADNASITALWVALFKGTKRLWHYELVADGAGVVSIAPTPSGELAVARVALKSTAKKKTNIT